MHHTPALPWSPLVELDAATRWCAQRPMTRMEAMTPQALLFLTGQLLAESRALLEMHWDPRRAQLPTDALRPFRASIALSFEALMLACVATRRACPDAVAPAPSLALSLATFARDLGDRHADRRLPGDLLAGLAEVEAARQAFLMAGFSPESIGLGRKAGDASVQQSCQALCLAVGRLLAAVEAGCPCAVMPTPVEPTPDGPSAGAPARGPGEPQAIPSPG